MTKILSHHENKKVEVTITDEERGASLAIYLILIDRKSIVYLRLTL
jgi:hypothetical protein